MIYVLRTSSSEASYLKIGYSNNPMKRIVSLRTGCPFATDLIFLGEGDKKDESFLHDKFRHLRTRGEWFEDKKEIAAHFGYKAFKPGEFRENDYWRPIEYFFKNNKKSLFSLKSAGALWGVDGYNRRMNEKKKHFEILNVNIKDTLQNYPIIGLTREENDYILIPLPEEKGAMIDGINPLFPLVRGSKVFNNKYGTYIEP